VLVPGSKPTGQDVQRKMIAAPVSLLEDGCGERAAETSPPGRCVEGADFQPGTLAMSLDLGFHPSAAMTSIGGPQHTPLSGSRPDHSEHTGQEHEHS